MSDYELFHPPIRQPGGGLQPNPYARYLTVDQITQFAQAIRAELKEVGGTMLLNKVEHIFRTLDNHIGQQMKEDDDEARRQKAEAEYKEAQAKTHAEVLRDADSIEVEAVETKTGP